MDYIVWQTRKTVNCKAFHTNYEQLDFDKYALSLTTTKTSDKTIPIKKQQAFYPKKIPRDLFIQDSGNDLMKAWRGKEKRVLNKRKKREKKQRKKRKLSCYQDCIRFSANFRPNLCLVLFSRANRDWNMLESPILSYSRFSRPLIRHT
ncbi:hypothetical protein CEXT_481631 [Caerostris extrusa]|uniref:Uncharacterized protein n=1 Tax=Caerostris extrusa TaxID=172846 RepID=A0AAV4QTX4_CAEEX|nr:hypothetical protein CEXT_481631 [Caerostris extrusa]